MEEEVLSLDAEFSDENIEEYRHDLYDRMLTEIHDYPGISEAQQAMERSARQLSQELETSGKVSNFLKPNPATQAEAVAKQTLDSDPRRRAKRLADSLQERFPIQDIPEAESWEEEDLEVAQHASCTSEGFKKFLMYVVLPFGIVAIAAALIWKLSPKSKIKPLDNASLSELGSESTNQVLEANQTFLSLVAQAAADQPIDFSNFGISQDTYAALKDALYKDRDTITNESWWQLLADRAAQIYPPTGKPLTLVDHYFALDFIATLLEPLYDPQPVDLELNDIVSQLSNYVDPSHSYPIEGLYRNVCSTIPDASGASRLQQIVLTKQAIARALTKTAATART